MAVTTALVVDKKGLAKKLANKPVSFILFELLQNSLDENPTRIEMEAVMETGKPSCYIRVEDDDPEGFRDLKSIYTMFRDSKKAPDPNKRGRFEIGEKLIIARARKTVVSTTKGVITIVDDTRKTGHAKRDKGTCVETWVKMTRAEFELMKRDVERCIIPSSGVKVYFNGLRLQSRTPVASVEVILPTIRSDEDGNLKTTRRKARIDVHEPIDGEPACIYEMGIPVVDTGDRYHYDVQQRVPINWERNNVPPAYLKAVRTAALDATSHLLSADEVKNKWVQVALDQAGEKAVGNVLDKQYGRKRVIADPSDPEGTKKAMSQGYTVIPGGAFDRGTWGRIKEFGAALPAGKVTPSKPDGRVPENLIPVSEWSEDMQRISKFARWVAVNLLDYRVNVRIFNNSNVSTMANYRRGELGLNIGKLGHNWFAHSINAEEVLSLLIHEYAHHYENDHLSSRYHDACCDLGARLARLALQYPEAFQ